MPIKSPSRRSPIVTLTAVLTANVLKSISLITFALLSANTSLFPAGDILQARDIPNATLIPVGAVFTQVPVPATVLTVTGEAVSAILLIRHVLTSVT